MIHTVPLSRYISISLLLAGFLFLATHVSNAAPNLPVAPAISNPIYVDAENQTRSGPLGVLVTGLLGGTHFEVAGNSKFNYGISIINGPLVINSLTSIGLGGQTKKLNIVGGSLSVVDSGSVVVNMNDYSPSNIQVEGLWGPMIAPICAEQSGKLVRC